MTSGIPNTGPVHGLASEPANGGHAVTKTPSEDEAAFWAGLFRDPAHGPLPALMLTLTAMSGLIDAVSILGLGRVFVANMTGNIVFIGFALARVPGFSLLASLAALVGFLIGAFLGGILGMKFAGHRGLLLRNACAVQFLLVVAAFAVVLPSSGLPGQGRAVVDAALLATAMGIQNTDRKSTSLNSSHLGMSYA